MVNLKDQKTAFEKVIDHFREELKTIRTGRANPAVVERVMVDSYGSLTPLQHVASISIPDARTIMISPWDKGVLKDIEKAIITAQLELNPVNDGTVIRITIPALTEEVRKNLLKIVGQKCEAARISLRGVRDGVKDEILKQEKAKEITEDDRFSLLEELDKITREYTGQVDEIGKKKEDEVMTV